MKKIEILALFYLSLILSLSGLPVLAQQNVDSSGSQPKVASDFVPGGETVNDGSVKLGWWMQHDLSVSAFVQYEKWLAPILSPTAQTNWTS